MNTRTTNLLVTVDWDTDGASLDDVGLTKQVVVLNAPTNMSGSLDKGWEEGDYLEELGEALTDTFGFCHLGWSAEELNLKTKLGPVLVMEAP